MTGPCIATTKRRPPAAAYVRGLGVRPRAEVLSRRAVATLDEAQKIIGRELAHVAAAVSIPDSGGTFTLPDGTVIEVEATTWRELVYVDGLPLVEAADYTARRAEQGDGQAQQRILDAYNARQANGGAADPTANRTVG